VDLTAEHDVLPGAGEALDYVAAAIEEQLAGAPAPDPTGPAPA
jgi:hypothetical protein